MPTFRRDHPARHGLPAFPRDHSQIRPLNSHGQMATLHGGAQRIKPLPIAS